MPRDSLSKHTAVLLGTSSWHLLHSVVDSRLASRCISPQCTAREERGCRSAALAARIRALARASRQHAQRWRAVPRRPRSAKAAHRETGARHQQCWHECRQGCRSAIRCELAGRWPGCQTSQAGARPLQTSTVPFSFLPRVFSFFSSLLRFYRKPLKTSFDQRRSTDLSACTGMSCTTLLVLPSIVVALEPLCKRHCPYNYLTVRCKWDGCSGCSECASPSSCKTYCQYNTHPLSVRCKWNGCGRCSECPLSSSPAPIAPQAPPSPPSSCKTSCAHSSHPVAVRCTWDGCHGCSECISNVTVTWPPPRPLRLAPSRSFKQREGALSLLVGTEANCGAVVGTLNAWLAEAGADTTGFACGETLAIQGERYYSGRGVGRLITSNDCEDDVADANGVLPLRLACSDACPDCEYRYTYDCGEPSCLGGPPWSARRVDYVTVSGAPDVAALNELLFPPPPPTHYSLGVAGRSCPHGTAVLDSWTAGQADCESIAVALGYNYEGVQFWHEGYPGPHGSSSFTSSASSPGCHYFKHADGHRSVFFNFWASEVPDRPPSVESTAGPICHWL